MHSIRSSSFNYYCFSSRLAMTIAAHRTKVFVRHNKFLEKNIHIVACITFSTENPFPFASCSIEIWIYLIPCMIPVTNPSIQFWSPIWDKISFSKLRTSPISKSSLCFSSCYDMYCVQVDLKLNTMQILLHSWKCTETTCTAQLLNELTKENVPWYKNSNI